MKTPFFVLVAFLAAAHAQPDPTSFVSYEEKFLQGVKAYSHKKWKDCIVHMRQAMDDYARLERARLACFTKCREEKPRVPSDYFDDDELKFFHSVIQRGTCIRQCEEELAGLQPLGGIPSNIQRDLDKREGYNYLQMALYQDGQVAAAAKACYSYAYYNPRNMHVKPNIKFYGGQPGVTEEDRTPSETIEYRDLFANGHVLFYKEEWEEMVKSFEQSLIEFYKALDDCKVMCDGPMRYVYSAGGGSLPQTMSQLFLSMTECRMNCVKKLGQFRYNRGEDFFGSYFHYLQQGYYYLNRSMDALQASATQVRLEPDSEAAKRNAVFYKQRPGVTKKDFKPREDIMPAIEQRELEQSFTRVFDDVSGHLMDVMEAEERGATDEADGTDEVLLEEDFKNFPVGGSHDHIMDEETEPIVSQISEDLKGEDRVVVDQLITEKQCEKLIELTSFAKEGDGYNRKSPHTSNEKFEGLHILDAAKMGAAGEVDRSLSWLYVNASHKVKDMLSQQFELKQPLYFSYTHLVCRTAKEGLQDDRKDISHPVHSDNCILDEAKGECHKVPPAYTWRDYSALLYLNGEFEGGEFFFAHSPKDLSPEVLVRPKCGRMVGFSAGEENMHGVLGVTGGRRCAVALWFTLDPAHREVAFDVAENVLSGKVTA